MKKMKKNGEKMEKKWKKKEKKWKNLKRYFLFSPSKYFTKYV
jgi:hypothetical protein